MVAKSKLTENMIACLKVLAQRHPERIWRAAEFPYRSNHSMTALEKRGMVDHDMYAGYGITPAGADAINRADLFAQPATAAAPDAGSWARWTASELAQYSEDNPYPPHKPGATADDTLASYEYEIAALKQERDTLLMQEANLIKQVQLMESAMLELISLTNDIKFGTPVESSRYSEVVKNVNVALRGADVLTVAEQKKFNMPMSANVALAEPVAQGE